MKNLETPGKTGRVGRSGIAVVTYQCRITQSKVVHQYGGVPMRDVT